MKTAMQEMIEWMERQSKIAIDNGNRNYAEHLNGHISVATTLLEKEKQQLIEAGNICGNMLIANDIVITGDHSLSVGENYYNQTFKP